MTRKLRVRTPLSVRRPVPARRVVVDDQPAEYSREGRVLSVLHVATIVTGVVAFAAVVVGLAVIP
ncbi:MULTISPECIES: hypothetical protein [unclassified Microbacterium]|uniref:hypothetical protein n=1 Tax=unclassified Microbacterium TaxID=2609290 RepID=UPI003C2F0216